MVQTIAKRLRHRVRRLGQVSTRERVLLAEATLRLLAARVVLATVPFPKIAVGLGGFMAPQHAAEKAAKHPISVTDEVIVRQIGWAVTRAARHVPFTALCLPQAMAARVMLQRRGIFSVMHFGTARGIAVSLQAHAWLSVGAVEVTGYPIAPDCIEIACLA